MRVLAITNMYPTADSPGNGVFVAEQIKGLRSIGVDVRVLFVDRRREGPLAYFRMRARIREAITEFDPQVIHVMYGGVLAERVVSRFHTRPVVITFHGSDLLGENLSGWRRKLVSRLGVRCSRRAARQANAVVVVARHLVDALKDAVPRHQVRVIPCGIDLNRFEPRDTQVCRRQLGWSPESFHVLFASSNGDPVKRPWLARAAVDQCGGSDQPVELHFLSGVPNPEVPVWLGAADVLLLTSAHEGSPTVVKEALACGLPVVSVDVGDVAERIQGIAGCHLASPDPESLAAKLRLVRRNGGRIECRARLDELSIVSVAHRLQQCYQDITAGLPSRESPARTLQPCTT